MKATFLAAAVVVLAALSPAQAAAAPLQSDGRIVHAVHRSIGGYPRFTVFDDVHARVEGDTAVLWGKVTIALKKEELGRRVAAVPGVRAVRNEIEVLPASSRDDALRQKVARAIYGNPAFWRYAALPNPPIHIIVENGLVTLTGRVPAEVDRALALSLATGHGEVAVVDALRTDGQGANP